MFARTFPLYLQILIAVVAGTIGGAVINWAGDSLPFSDQVVAFSQFLGSFFLNALKMIIVPLILSSIICGVASMGTGGHIGRLGAKTLGFYLLSSTLAILIGLAAVNAIKPGYINGEPAGEAFNLSDTQEVATALEKVEGKGAGDFAQIFLRLVPPNLIDAASDNGQMLGVITFGILFGFFMMRIDVRLSNTLKDFWQAVFEVMMHITHLIMKLAPFGVFGLVLVTLANTGIDVLRQMLAFFLTVVLALATHAFIVMPLLLKFLGKVKHPYRQVRAMAPALLTGFSTASSSGTLPVTMDCMEKNAKVSKRTCSFVLPLGATVNMDGTALYECVAAMFIAQAYGLELTFGVQFTIVAVALLTSIGVAGVPSASLVAITVILSAIGLPLEGIGLLLVTDRLLDMVRTAVNIFSDSCCATVIAKTEGEKGVLDEP